jgi:hypothetical protein
MQRTPGEGINDLVERFEAALDEILDPFALSELPLPSAARLPFLSALVAGYCEHREVLRLFLRDLPSCGPTTANSGFLRRVERITELLAGREPTGDHRIVVDAVLGVIARPLLDPATNTDDVRTRRLILAMAVDLAERLGNEASRSWSEGSALV